MRTWVVFAVGLALRLALIAKFPLIFGGDSMLRMIHRNQILISHQLPLLQTIVFVVSQMTHSYVAIMVAMAVVGAAVAPAFYLLLRGFVAENTAFLAALLITTNPFLVGYSVVPFQESLMLVMLIIASYYLYLNQLLTASLFLGLACITRFEAWIAAFVFLIVFVAKRGLKGLFVGTPLFGWAPAAWMIFERGLAPPGSYVIESHVTIARLMRWVYLGYITLKFTPVIVIGLSIFGLWLLWRENWWLRLWPLITLFGLFSLALLFSAHGDLPDPERRIASREATLWIAAAVMLAAIALDKLARYRTVIATAGVLFGIWGSYQFVAREASDPRLVLSWRLAKFFDNTLQPGERALILSPPWSEEVFDFYLRRARKTGGQAGYEAAVRNLTQSDTSPPDYQRTLIHSRLGRDQLLSTDGQCTQWVAVWSDYASPPALPSPQSTLRADGLAVRVSRQVCPP
jgi:hypothetical protein